MSLEKWWLKKAAKLYAWVAEEAKKDPDASYAEYAEARKLADEAARLANEVPAKDKG